MPFKTCSERMSPFSSLTTVLTNCRRPCLLGDASTYIIPDQGPSTVTWRGYPVFQRRIPILISVIYSKLISQACHCNPLRHITHTLSWYPLFCSPPVSMVSRRGKWWTWMTSSLSLRGNSSRGSSSLTAHRHLPQVDLSVWSPFPFPLRVASTPRRSVFSLSSPRNPVQGAL